MAGLYITNVTQLLVSFTQYVSGHSVYLYFFLFLSSVVYDIVVERRVLGGSGNVYYISNNQNGSVNLDI